MGRATAGKQVRLRAAPAVGGKALDDKALDGEPAACASSAGKAPAVLPLDHVSFVIGKVFYDHLGALLRVLAETGLAKHVQPGMGHILFALFEEDNRTLKDLVDRVDLSYSTLSGMVSRMRRAKLITCRRDTLDARSVRIRLTPLGKSLEPRCQAALATIDRIMCEGVSPQDLATTYRTLKHMAHGLREHEKRQRGQES